MREIVEQSGDLILSRSGSTWEILWGGMFLMSSECRASERALGELASGRTLVGGLGMGFTLRAALDAGAVSIDVVEISQAVIGWNRSVLAEVAGRPLDDERVQVHERDLVVWLAQATRGHYDRVLIDVDNGPSWTAQPENDRLYGDDGVGLISRVLAPGGVAAIWSAQREPALIDRLHAMFSVVEERAIEVEVGGRPSSDYLIVASGSRSSESQRPR